MSDQAYDAIVIGGGFNGLAAAACLARAGKKPVLLEASDSLGGQCSPAAGDNGFALPFGSQTLSALDPALIKQIGLAKAGLKFAVRDLPLVGLRGDGRYIVLTRNARATASAIAIHSKRDAEIWPRFQRELFDLGRALRPFWNGEQEAVDPKARGAFEQLSRTSAVAWLDSWFETEALKSTLLFDAMASAHSVFEAGSALAFVWRASQEMSGLQGAVALPLGGLAALAQTVIAVARNLDVEMRTGTRAQSILLNGTEAVGVKLASGEEVRAPSIICSISRSETFEALLPPLAAGIANSQTQSLTRANFAEVRMGFSLNAKPELVFTGVPLASRFVVAERVESYADAETMARDGQVGNDVPLELVIQTAWDETLAPLGQHILNVVVRPTPALTKMANADLESQLVERVKMTLGRYFPHLPASIMRTVVQTAACPVWGDADTAHFTGSPAENIASPISGLYFCGTDTEPMNAISGRAARIAAAMAAGTSK